MGKVKYNFDLCAAGCRREGNLLFNFKFEYFIQAVKFRWPTRKLLWSPNFSPLTCDPFDTRYDPLRGNFVHN